VNNLKQHITPAQQNLLIQQKYSNFDYSWSSGVGVWKGKLQPTPISPQYDVLIKYNMNRVPHVWVLRPEINEHVPHRYGDKSLCIYWYKEWPWSPDQDISLTIIPWTAFWLYFYEIWLDTGVWFGKSAPHKPINTLGEINGR
jgi:hypothetical protein